MKSIKFILVILSYNLLLTSCIEVDLIDVLPEIPDGLCNSVNPNRDFDKLLWEETFNSNLDRVNIQSSPMILDDKIIIGFIANDDLTFHVYDKYSGELLEANLILLEANRIENIRLEGNRILIQKHNEIHAINADDFTLEWSIDYVGSGRDNNRYIVTSNGAIYSKFEWY